MLLGTLARNEETPKGLFGKDFSAETASSRNIDFKTAQYFVFSPHMKVCKKVSRQAAREGYTMTYP